MDTIIAFLIFLTLSLSIIAFWFIRRDVIRKRRERRRIRVIRYIEDKDTLSQEDLEHIRDLMTGEVTSTSD